MDIWSELNLVGFLSQKEYIWSYLFLFIGLEVYRRNTNNESRYKLISGIIASFVYYLIIMHEKVSTLDSFSITSTTVVIYLASIFYYFLLTHLLTDTSSKNIMPHQKVFGAFIVSTLVFNIALAAFSFYSKFEITPLDPQGTLYIAFVINTVLSAVAFIIVRVIIFHVTQLAFLRPVFIIVLVPLSTYNFHQLIA